MVGDLAAFTNPKKTTFQNKFEYNYLYEGIVTSFSLIRFVHLKKMII